MEVAHDQIRNVSEEVAARYLCLSVSALRKSRMNGEREGHLPPPPFVRLGRRVIYRLADLDRYLEANVVASPPVTGSAK